jgi:hypothetical protein
LPAVTGQSSNRIRQRLEHRAIPTPSLPKYQVFASLWPETRGRGIHKTCRRSLPRFNHVDEFVAAGGLGAVFGTGAGNQTYITTDGDQFKNGVRSYFANPLALP